MKKDTMTKYAIVPINMKQIDDNLFIRCVLISYKRLKGNIYEGTKVLDCSPYFKDSSKALQYKFEDDGYTLIMDGHGNSDSLRMIKRPYHLHSSSIVDERLNGTTFECNFEKVAFDIFHSSEYYDCDTTPMKVKR